jgi:hypothetical protein
MGRRKRGKPLLYVEQPSFDELKPNMQDVYRWKNNEAEESHEDRNISQVQEKSEENRLIKETIKEKEREQEKEKEKEKTELKRKPFNELTIDGKIDYLEQFPASIVKILYAFTTKDNKIVAYFVSANEGTIKVIPLGKRKPVIIAVKDIIDINVYGL